CSAVIDHAEKAAQPLALGCAILRIDRRVDVDLEFTDEEVSEGAVREVEHVAALAAPEHLVDEAEVNRTQAAHAMWALAISDAVLADRHDFHFGRISDVLPFPIRRPGRQSL